MPHCKIEGGALVGLALGPNRAAMPMNDALDGGQANPSAGKLVLTVKPLKCAKQPLNVGHIKARPIIAHKERPLAVCPRSPKLNLGQLAPTREFPGIIEQIGQHYAQQLAITLGHQAWGNG